MNVFFVVNNLNRFLNLCVQILDENLFSSNFNICSEKYSKNSNLYQKHNGDPKLMLVSVCMYIGALESWFFLEGRDALNSH